MNKQLFAAAVLAIAGLAFAGAPGASRPAAVQVSQVDDVDDWSQDLDGGSVEPGAGSRGSRGSTGTEPMRSEPMRTEPMSTDPMSTDPLGADPMGTGTDTTGSDVYRGSGSTGAGKGKDGGTSAIPDTRTRSRGSTADDTLDNPPLTPERDALPGTIPPSRTSIPGAGK